MATGKWYGLGVSHVLNGAVDWDTDTIKLMLTSSSYTPDQDADDFRNDVTNELSSSGTYTTSGGNTLTGCTRTYDSATNEVRLDANDFSVTSFTGAPRWAVIYKNRGGASSADELIGYIDLGAQSVTAGTFTIVFDSTGVLKAVVS